MKSFPKVFVIILNYNGKETINACLASVFKNNYPNFEVVVVDNNSTDGSFEMAKSGFSKANFIKNEENLGFSSGNNAGIRFSLERGAEYVFLMNNDAEGEVDFLKNIVHVAEEKKETGVLSPVIFNKETKQIWFSGGKINWLRMKSVHETDAKKEEASESEYVTGCAMLIRAEVFKKIGLFDEDFFLYWEDADFSIRSRRAGFKNTVVSNSWVYHSEKSNENNRNKIYWLVFSGILFFKKNTPWFFKPWIFFFLFARKTKNRLDIFWNKNDQAEMVKKAYADFDRAKYFFEKI
jgi:GT2 family glycosyltransferase